MRWPWRWYRFTVVVVGEESGHVSSVPFVRFRHEREAFLWVQRMNSRPRQPGLTHWEVRPILRGRGRRC